MARHPVAKFHGGYAHNNCSSRLVLLALFVLLLANSTFARPAELQPGSGDSNNSNQNVASNFLASSWVGILLSLGFLIVFVSLLALCGAGGCCGNIQWFGRSRQDAPLSFSNPMTEPAGATMMVPISQIDVRALELDPIVFEPLPTVSDLTPISNKVSIDRGQNFNHHHHRSPIIPIVPFNADDSTVFAHDWFEEPHNNFPRSNIEYVKEIGKGWFGQVIEAEARDIVPFARKIRVIVKLLREDANGIEQMRFLDESRMYRDGNHGNILKLMGHSIEKLPFLLIMEHCPQGDLKSFLISNVIRAELLNSQGTIVKMALDVAKGLEWLHNAGFVHPDLAARNCQVGSENRVVIGDYGLGTQNFKDDYHWSSNVAIPLRWTAPETLHCTSSIIQILKVTESSNIWTLGAVIWEICEFGKLPYFELADDEVIVRVIADKNYTLGRPTLPCMSAKEEVYTIMSSCWTPEIETRPRLYTVVRQLEEVYKALTKNLATPSKDEFETKWEQLGSRAGSDEDKRRKKVVSFLDLESKVRSLDLGLSTVNESMEPPRDDETVASGINNDIVSEQQQKELDAEEEQWTKKFERGEISQKVLEKSQSVQDLMVLTHFEQNDFGDMDSLVYIGKPSQPLSSLPDAIENGTGKDSLDSSGNSASGNGSSANNSLRKSCSEPAIDRLSLLNSSQNLTPSSNGDDADSHTNTLTPGSFSNPFATGVDINLIAATPKTPVEINVEAPTPNRTPKSTEGSFSDTKSDKAPSDDARNGSSPKSKASGRKLHFRFDDLSPDPQRRQRQTSTPIRSGSTPSPRISDFGDDNNELTDEDLPVFEGTFSLSPISQHYVTQSSLNSSKMEQSMQSDFGSVVIGSDYSHELGSYQGVKSQLFETRNPTLEEDEDEVGFVQETTKYSTTPKNVLPRRIDFGNGDPTNGEDALETSDEITATNENTWVKFDTSNGSVKIPGEEKKENAEADHDDFWKQQLLSLQSAADTTRELFQTGLHESEVMAANKADDKRFVEAIEADVEELGSLVLHDLEEPDSMTTVIKETREAIKPEDGVSAKLAFEGTTSSNSEQWSHSSEETGSREESSSSTHIVPETMNESEMLWDINNSIEIRKSRKEKLSSDMAPSKEMEGAGAKADCELEDLEEPGDVATEFVPSKWNQSLVPSRSAIKSPEQQPKSGMKKSVSFEMKKTQLVYEYPPPPVTSDSEEEEKLTRSAIASASVPLASSLDWELTQEELEEAEINHEDWDDEVMSSKPEDPMDVYRISGFSDDNFQVRGSHEPFVFSPSTLGELRHTKDRLRLDLSRGEANFLDDDPAKASLSNPARLDSGVGSSTNVSPFNNCDILTKRSKNSD